MKPEVREEGGESSTPLTGDAIGDTAYSERFVLKLLLKLANLDTLKEELKDKSFEDDLCTLWDMTAERDVVLFLEKHNMLNLLNFALPGIESPRIIEIIVGIVVNMCCQKETVTTLLKIDHFGTLLLENIRSADSFILIQVLRLVNCAVYSTDDEDIPIWLKMFKNVGYSTSLYYMIKNSVNKELLVTAFENLNTICLYCNIEKTRTDYFKQFITSNALESLSVGFTELIVIQKDLCDKEEIERVLIITLQILMNFVDIDKSLPVYKDNKDYALLIITKLLTYIQNKLMDDREVDSDLIDIIESTNTILGGLQPSETSDPEKYFVQGYNMWKTVHVMTQSDEDDSGVDEEVRKNLRYSRQIKLPLATLICIYMEKCSERNLIRVLDAIGKDYEDIMCSITEELQMVMTKRSANYRSRLTDNVDS